MRSSPPTPSKSSRSRKKPGAPRRRAAAILDRLRKAYPQARCSLHFSNPLQLLVATILSAQCTDERVNRITPALFRQFPTARDYVAAPAVKIEEAVRTAGLYRHKARHIRETCSLLVQRHQGQVPHTMEELVRLPGVGRKTANVIMGNAFGLQCGIAVDTHAGRVSRRLGLTASADPARIERDLMEVIPKEEWTQITHLFIAHGREICSARSPRCPQCPLRDLCPYFSSGTSGRRPSPS